MLDKPAPDFELPATGGKTFRLSRAKGSPLVLYFYPKDNTPGCTTEGQHFRDLYPEFQKLRLRRSTACRATASSRTRTSRPR